MPTLWTKNPRLVQTIDTTAFGTDGIGSSDPAGLTYIPGPTPGTGHIILVDSEVDETPFFKTNNLFVLSETGQFQSSVDLVTNVTMEPTGAAYDPTGNRLFISDDDSKGIFIVSASDPGGTPLGFIDVSAISSDTEDPLYDPTTGHLMFLEGGTGKNARTVYELTTEGAIVGSIKLPAACGDVEGLAFDPVDNVFYTCGGTSPYIYVVSRDGTTILDTISVLVGLINPISGIEVAPKGLILAPSSDPNDDPSVMSLWVADYGEDQHKADGRLFEIRLGTSVAPLFSDAADTVDFNAFQADLYDSVIYKSLGGDDTIVLPATALAAATAGYNFAIPFYGGDGNDTISGGGLNDVIYGDLGNDLLRAGAGANHLYGGDGNDTLVAGGTDKLYGGNGIDWADFSQVGGPVSINIETKTATNALLSAIENAIGSAFDDTITGSSIANALAGGDGADALFGGGGNDTLSGDAGNDSLFGGSGNDQLVGGSGNNLLDGGSGNDNLAGGNQDDILDGGAGTDTLAGGGGDDVFLIRNVDAQSDAMSGGDGFDTLRVAADSGIVTLAKLQLPDIEVFEGGGQIIQGTSSANTFDFSTFQSVTGVAAILGLAGNDKITGSSGADLIDGGSGTDTLAGGGGDDIFLIRNADAQSDAMSGGDGFDTLRVAADSGIVTLAKLQLPDIEVFDGGWPDHPGHIVREHVRLLDLPVRDRRRGHSRARRERQDHGQQRRRLDRRRGGQRHAVGRGGRRYASGRGG